MKYSELPVGYKRERILSMIRNLDNGEVLVVSSLYLEEVKFLRAMYGKELKTTNGNMYRVG